MLVKHRVHEGDLGSAAPCLSLGWTELSNSEENMQSQGNNESQGPKQKVIQDAAHSQMFLSKKNNKSILNNIRRNKTQMLHLEAPEAAAAWKADVADVRRAV